MLRLVLLHLILTKLGSFDMFLHKKTYEYDKEKRYFASQSEILIIKVDLLENSLLEGVKFTLAGLSLFLK